MINNVDVQRFTLLFKGKTNTYVRNELPKTKPEAGQKIKTKITNNEGIVDKSLLMKHLVLGVVLRVGYRVDRAEVDAGDQERAAVQGQCREELTHHHARDGHGRGQKQLLGAQFFLLGEQAHGQKGNEDADGEQQDGEIGRGVVAVAQNGGVAAEQGGKHQEDTQIDVSDRIDEIRAHLFAVDGKHNRVPFFGR